MASSSACMDRNHADAPIPAGLAYSHHTPRDPPRQPPARATGDPEPMSRSTDARNARAGALSDALAFSPLIPATLAFVLTHDVAVAIAPQASPGARAELAALAGAGAAVVYGLDRLRDRDRDRETSPKRTAFVERQRPILVAATIAAALVAIALATRVASEVVMACTAIGAAGVLHRRLKRFAAVKTLYVSLAWTAVCVGVPWLGLTGDTDGREVALALGAALFPCFVANLIASNLRDGESHWHRDDPERGLVAARILVAVACAAALLGPPPARVFACVALASALALARYRRTEHYGHLAIDGSLLAGALAVALLQAAL